MYAWSQPVCMLYTVIESVPNRYSNYTFMSNFWFYNEYHALIKIEESNLRLSQMNTRKYEHLEDQYCLYGWWELNIEFNWYTVLYWRGRKLKKLSDSYKTCTHSLLLILCVHVHVHIYCTIELLVYTCSLMVCIVQYMYMYMYVYRARYMLHTCIVNCMRM